MHVAPIFPHLTSLIQLTVEPQSLQSVASCSLTPTQQKVQWWCFIATQALCQKERWPQCVGVMVNGTPTQEVWTALLQVCSEKLCSPSWEPAKQILLCFKFIMLALQSSFFHTGQLPMAILVVAVVACTCTLLLSCVITIVGFVRFKKHMHPGKYLLLRTLWFTFQYSLPSTFCFCECLIQDALWRHQLQGNCHSLLIMLN